MNRVQLSRQFVSFHNKKAKQHTPPIYRALREQVEYWARTRDLNNLPIGPLSIAINNLYKDAGPKWAFKTYQDVLKDAGLKRTLNSAGNALARPVKARRPIGFNQDFVNSILEHFRLNLLNDAVLPITETTRDYISRRLNQGLAEGHSLQEITDDLLNDTDLPKWRAKNIARTEILKAANKGETIGTDKTGLVTVKEWISVQDERTRRDHLTADGQKVPDDKSFIIGLEGWTMEHPGDSRDDNGLKIPAKEVCNCRCCVGRHVVYDSSGEPAFRPGATPLPPIKPRPPVKPPRQRPPLPMPPVAAPPKPEPPPLPVFKPAKTIKEAEQWAKDNLGVKYANYNGVHIDVANDMNKATFTTKQLLPKIRTVGLGGTQTANRAMKEKILKEYRETDFYKRIARDYSPAAAERQAKRFANDYAPAVGPNNLAWSQDRTFAYLPGGGKVDINEFTGVFVNEKNAGNKAYLDKIVKDNRATNWFAEGAEDFRYIITHELGHEIDKTIGFRDSAGFLNIYNREKATENITQKLSRYAATAGGKRAKVPAEVIAESWAEFIHAANPRPLSREVSEAMLKAYYEANRQTINLDYFTWYNEIIKLLKNAL